MAFSAFVQKIEAQQVGKAGSVDAAEDFGGVDQSWRIASGRCAIVGGFRLLVRTAHGPTMPLPGGICPTRV